MIASETSSARTPSISFEVFGSRDHHGAFQADFGHMPCAKENAIDHALHTRVQTVER
jgi:hypothetical protein